MKTKFKKGQAVIVTEKNGNKIYGIISDIDINLCSGEIQYSVDFLKDGKRWTMISVPGKAIELVQLQ